MEMADYISPQNSIGGALPPLIQATYKQGENIEVAANMLANHFGHLELLACPIGSYGLADARIANHC